MRAGTVVVGTSGAREALQRGRVALVVLAGDYARRTDEKVGRLARARRVPVLMGPPASELGRRIGRTAVQAVAVQDPRLAAGIRALKNVE
ncbi:MAG: ribosomal L7Ae/L30e/S12e/Gadd45 family protein [Gemmatimonadetes bacterium]|nr:ribosomal L7Ae/L30e/S12e/Gadd45 family protein [Gemmatimonadota bacterium]MBI2616114.1 ribosomal L7Ae/L30e/S12e/Gadd45 family protein [Gemmatimonadota bacterium]